MLTTISDLIHRIIHMLDHTILMGLALLAARYAAYLPFHKSGLIKYNDWLNTGFSPDAFSITVYMFDPANGDDAVFAVPGLDPVLGAWAAMAGEMILPFLLLFGFAGRIGALGLLVMTAVIQIAAPESWEHHLLWAVCLAFVALKGPGIISIDHFIRARILGR